MGIFLLPNVKEHAPLSARASFDHGVEVEDTGGHVNKAADKGCCVSACSASWGHSEKALAKHPDPAAPGLPPSGRPDAS